MSNLFETYIKSGYLLKSETDSTLILAILILSAVLTIGPIIATIVFKLLKRKDVYKKFDRIWFWGYITFGLLGLFVWFSQYESLPFFSLRIVSYSWKLALAIFTIIVFFIFKKKAPRELSKYYEKKRKEKYLK